MPHRASASWAAWTLGTLLAWGFAFLSAWLSAARLSPDLVPLAGASAAWLGGLLFLVPLALAAERPLIAMASAACLTGILAAALLVLATPCRFPLPTAILVAMMLYLVAAVVRLAAPRPAHRPAVAAWVLFLLVLVAASPVWLGPPIDRLQPGTGTIDALVAVNPLTHLAVVARVDYLRSDWLYRHSPLGGLRFDYPSPAVVLGLYLLACASLSPFVRRSTLKLNSEAAR